MNAIVKTTTRQGKREQLNLRISAEDKAKLAELAEADNRDMTGWIIDIARREHAKLRRTRRPPAHEA